MRVDHRPDGGRLHAEPDARPGRRASAAGRRTTSAAPLRTGRAPRRPRAQRARHAVDDPRGLADGDLDAIHAYLRPCPPVAEPGPAVADGPLGDALVGEAADDDRTRRADRGELPSRQRGPRARGERASPPGDGTRDDDVVVIGAGAVGFLVERSSRRGAALALVVIVALGRESRSSITWPPFRWMPPGLVAAARHPSRRTSRCRRSVRRPTVPVDDHELAPRRARAATSRPRAPARSATRRART